MNFEQIKKLKEEFETLKGRINKAHKYLDNQNIPISEREKYLRPYLDLVDRMSEIIDIFTIRGIKYDCKCVKQGFL